MELVQNRLVNPVIGRQVAIKFWIKLPPTIKSYTSCLKRRWGSGQLNILVVTNRHIEPLAWANLNSGWLGVESISKKDRQLYRTSQSQIIDYLYDAANCEKHRLTLFGYLGTLFDKTNEWGGLLLRAAAAVIIMVDMIYVHCPVCPDPFLIFDTVPVSHHWALWVCSADFCPS